GYYLFATALFTKREGVFAAVLYVLCPPVLLHNDQFTAETFLFSAAPLLYWALLKAMRPDKARLIWAAVAILLGGVLLLFKQSGFLLLAVSVFLPLARLGGRAGGVNRPAKEFVRNISLVFAVIVCSVVAANAFLPAEFNATREHFNSRWTMSFHELVGLPLTTWKANLNVVADYIGSYYSWVALLFFGIFSWLALRRKNFGELTLVLICLAGATGVIFLLRGFNEYLFHTAIITAFLPLLARMGAFIHDLVQERKAGLLTYAAVICAGLLVAHWGYQDILMNVSAGKYIERSSRWARANYLQSWPTGFGVREIVGLLEKEKRPGIVFVDPQWGNPRTALEVYAKRRFPNLRIEGVTREFLDSQETRKLRDLAAGWGSVHLVIYSADSSGKRERWQANINAQMCDTRSEIKAYPSQMPIVVCQF
ncbi:MAG TPA: glycosyltransferase family 39 protein, partial [Verrucomicrobiae bacterium]|nr:glycosyltransferase family 39 protein [Verrucomicrobiae bacterium]